MRPCATTLESEMTDQERSFLLSLLQTEKLSGAHLEIGTAAGGTLCAMMNSFDDDERPAFVVVDRMRYFDRQFESICTNLRNNGLSPDDVDFRQTNSVEAWNQAKRARESFDFILVDASHKVIAVTSDLRWTRFLNVGGVICFHDYCEKFPGVKKPVDRFLSRQPNYEVLGQAGNLLAIRKTAASSRPEVSISDRIHSLLQFVPCELERKRQKRERLRKAA